MQQAVSPQDLARFMQVLLDLEHRGRSAEGAEIATALGWTWEHAWDVASEVFRLYEPSALEITFDRFAIDPV